MISRCKRIILPAIMAALTFLPMISCCQEPVSEPGAPLSCEQPAFLQPGDKIALISPSFFTSKENVLSLIHI